MEVTYEGSGISRLFLTIFFLLGVIGSAIFGYFIVVALATKPLGITVGLLALLCFAIALYFLFRWTTVVETDDDDAPAQAPAPVVVQPSNAVQEVRETRVEEVKETRVEVIEAPSVPAEAPTVVAATEEKVVEEEQTAVVDYQDGTQTMLVKEEEQEEVTQVVEVLPDESMEHEHDQGSTDPYTTAYCVRCKMKREMHNPQQVLLKNGRHAMEGVCPVCGTKLFRIVHA